MSKCKEKKTEQLGMNPSTASGRLRKNIMFSLIQKAGLDTCFQCSERIVEESDLSVEHKVPWLDSETPIALFFDLDNISFSHLRCNVSAARQPNKFKSDKERKASNNKRDKLWRENNAEKRKEIRRNSYLKNGN